MTLRTLILRSLRFHWRSHLGVVLGAAVGSAALIGALVVGDSVKSSLRQRGLERLGQIHFALPTADRLVRSDLAVSAAVPKETWEVIARLHLRYRMPPPSNICSDDGQLDSALVLPGVASTPDGSARANQVQVVGVSPENWPTLAGWASLQMPLNAWRGETVEYVPPSWVHLFSTEPLRGGIRSPLSELAKQHRWTPAQQAMLGRVAAQSRAWQQGETAFVNETFARQLGLREGDTFIIRLRKPTALSADAAVSPRDSDAVTLRLQVGRVLPAAKLGDFALTSLPAPPPNVFLPREILAGKIGQPGRANLLLQGALSTARPPNRVTQAFARWLPHLVVQQFPSLANTGPPQLDALEEKRALDFLRSETAAAFTPEDAQLEVHAVEQPQTTTGGEYVRPFVEISSPRIFLETAIQTAALTSAATSNAPSRAFITNGVGVLTYLVNLLAAGTNATPYSMVTAAGPPWTPADLRDDEIVIADWLARDLGAQPGGELKLVYFLPDSGAQLREATNRFRVRAVVPMRGVHADRTLMPEFPGIQKAESTRDWDAGFPLVHAIRDQDEAYWKQFRGTPKAFVTLAAGQKLWGNRFGNLTALRFPVPPNSFAGSVQKAVYDNLRSNLPPAALGLRWEPVREQALRAAAQAQDFGGLFLGFSFFLIAAALLLMALLFQFGVEQRITEIGTLLALGFTPKQVRRLWLAEGAGLALIGAVLGTFGGVAYARAMLLGLTTVWADAVGGSALHFFVTPASLVLGLVSSTLVATLTIWLTLRQLARRPARELLAGMPEETTPSSACAVDPRASGPRRLGVRGRIAAFQELWPCRTRAKLPRASKSGGKSPHSIIGWLALTGAVALVAWALMRGDTANAGAFFGAGALVLIAGLGFVNARWAGMAGSPSSIVHRPSSLALSLRGLARRRSRSLATVALLACGSFLIASIGVFRLDANRDATQHASGTGGFALIGEATLPIVQDLNTQAGRDFLGLNEGDLAGVNFVQFRVRDGDEASCLNLNRAQKPRLLGVKSAALAGRFTFAKGAGWSSLGEHGGWKMEDGKPAAPATNAPSSMLHPPSSSQEIAAIGDAASIEWAMGKKVGDTLDYVDERGQPFKVRIVGAVANSILQGSLLVDEAELLKRFPSESGYRFFLLDAPSNSVARVSAALSRALQDYGFEVTPAARRLAQFNAVQNTYLGTFQVLGGLGLLLGSAGLGVVVLRNVLERRGELALLLAVGWRRRAIQRLVLTEHAVLLGLGLGIGVVAAAVAVLPALLSPGAQLPWATLLPTLAGVPAVGALATWLATRWALRGNLLAALRNE